MNHNLKTILILVAILAIAGLGYKFLIVNNRIPSIAAVSTTDVTDQTAREVVTMLEKLRTLKLDKSIFTNEMFLSLEDFNVQVIDEERGRQNPFMPFEPEPTISKSKPPSVLRRE
ncbi:MAG TPA: hypothetical protein VI981_00785 [Candidatus Paceibacterota bacterium]